jgi:hypothetical protein
MEPILTLERYVPPIRTISTPPIHNMIIQVAQYQMNILAGVEGESQIIV